MHLYQAKSKTSTENKLFYVWLSGIYECVMTGAIAYFSYMFLL